MDAVPCDRTLSVLRQGWFLLALALFFLAINVQFVFKVLDPERANRTAFLRWTNQIQALEAGTNIWEKHGYPNPPIMALLLKPLMGMPPLAGSLVWFYLKLAMAVLALYWALRMLDCPDRPFPLWGKALVILLSVRPIQGDLMHGNVNLFLLFLVVGGLYAFTCRRDVLAGVVLGLAIACKLTPALFIPYFLWKRAWKTLLGCGLGLALFLWVVPSLFLGWGKNQEALGSWYNYMVKPFVVEGGVTYSDAKNQSLAGLAYRLLTHSPSWSRFDFDADRYVGVEYYNVADWSPAAVRWLLYGCMGACGFLGMWLFRTPADNRQDWRWAGEFGLVFLGMLLFSERTWKHHCVTLVVPFAVLAYYLSAHWADRGMRWFLGCILTLATVLMLTSSSSFYGTARAADLALVYGAYTWALAVLTVGLGVLLWQRGGVMRRTREIRCEPETASGKQH